MYRALGIPEIGALLSCNRDFSLVEGFNPAVKLTRTQTVMEGASHCDFRFELRRPKDVSQPVVRMTSAVAIDAHGGLEQIRLRADWPEPTTGPGQAVVDVKACGLNYLDIFVLHGMLGLPVEMPRIPGGDVSGVVSAVGAGVAREWVGRRVLIDPHIKSGGALGENGNGGLCEKIAVDAANLIHLPDAVTFEQAAAAARRLWHGAAHDETRGKLQPGEKVLILGASGGVGTCCVQLAKILRLG